MISFVSAHAAQITWPHGERAFLAERAAPPSRAPNASLVDARIPGANATKRRRWFSREASLLDALRKAYDKAQRCLHAAARHEHRPHARQGRGGGERLRRRPQALHPTAAGLGERCAGRCPRSGRRAAPPQRHAQPIAAARLLCGDVALHGHRGERHFRAVRLHPRQRLLRGPQLHVPHVHRRLSRRPGAQRCQRAGVGNGRSLSGFHFAMLLTTCYQDICLSHPSRVQHVCTPPLVHANT